MTKILVTGGTGFIGKHLVNYLRDLDHEVMTIGRKRIMGKDYVAAHAFYLPPGSNNFGYIQGSHFSFDLKDGSIIKRMFNDYYQPDVIIHLAGNALVKDPQGIFRDNVEATQNLLTHCPEGCRFIFASSIVVYGNGKQYPKCTEFDLPKPTSEYGISKLASEHLVNMFTERGRVRGVNLRFCATVGRGLTHGVIFDFMRKLKEEDTLEILGSQPGSTKPYLHVDDAVSAIKLMMEKDKIKGSWNVTPDNEVNIEQLAMAAMRGLGISKPLVWLGEKANWVGDNRYLCASNGQMKGLGWSPKRDSFEAIKQAVKDLQYVLETMDED